MKHIRLKFNYGVEIGARLAYLGHFKATGDFNILRIASEEFGHQEAIRNVLAFYGEKPFFLFNWFFYVIGNFIRLACIVSPKFMLDFVASLMESFAIYNYKKLADEYPRHYALFMEMSKVENAHRFYFDNL